MQDMVDDLLIRQYAKANGITVSADEVEKAAQEALNYYPNGTPNSHAYTDGVGLCHFGCNTNGIDNPDFYANRCAYRDSGSNLDSFPNRDTQPDQLRKPPFPVSLRRPRHTRCRVTRANTRPP